MNWWSVKLAIICVFVFILQFMISGFTDMFVLNSSLVLERPWTMVTSIFLHGDFMHIFYNMFALIFFGLILESIIGSRKFLMLYFISGLVASIGAVLFYNASLGASGAIYGILGALGVLRPKMTVWFSGIPLPMALAVVLWAAGDFIGLFAPGEVAYAAHLFGLAAGIIFGVMFYKKFKELKNDIKIKSISDKEFKRWEDSWMN